MLVVEKVGWLLPRAIAHRLEGSRFGACPTVLAIFASTRIPPTNFENKRLPGTSHRDAFSLGFRLVYTGAIEPHRVRLIPGARLL
jgi:hypothetical protein